MDGKGVVTSKTVKEEVKNSAFNLGFAAKPALRLGWTF
jgi:hypothetical protein